jgi:protein TonB
MGLNIMLRDFTLLIFLLLSFNCFSQSNSIPDKNEFACILPIYAQPEFTGGQKAMSRFIYKHLNYPMKATKDSIEGTVIIKFLVGKAGKLSEFQITRSLSKECDDEVIKVFKLMPKWKPGDDTRGKSYFLFPITFRL